MLKWGKAEFGAVSLGAIAAHCSAALREEI
ncbi:hypothetical protein, partial [Methylomonas albis]